MLAQLEDAKNILSSGGLMGFPTETSFGLAVDPSSDSAVTSLLKLKDRPEMQGISIILDSEERVEQLALVESDELSRIRKELQAKHWPGALTLISRVDLSRFPLSNLLLGPNNSIAYRVSSNSLARSIAASVGGWVTATSANPRGKSPAISSKEFSSYYPDVSLIRGECQNIAAGSTIIDVSEMPIKLIRAGAVELAISDRSG